MAIETFPWATESGGEGDITFATRSAQFGDGYKQLVSEGLNSKSQSWPVSITGPAATIKAAMDFLDRHSGARAFLWTPPWAAWASTPVRGTDQSTSAAGSTG